MHHSSRTLAAAALGAALTNSAPAAASVDLGLGADYWIDQQAEFNLTLGLRAALTRSFSVGARFGALLTTGPTDVGVPLDLQLRIHASRIYIDGLVGPWLIFGRNRPLRAHAAFGFGLASSSLTFGLEVGWLSDSPLMGLRLGVRL